MSNPDPSAVRSTEDPQFLRLPSQVRRQVERSRQLEAERRGLAAPPQTPEPPPDAPTPPADAAIAQDQPPEAGAAHDVERRIDVRKLDLADLIRLTDYSAPDPSRENDPGYWKARYLVADGIAKKTREVNEQNRKLVGEVSDLRSQLEAAKTQVPPPEAKPSAAESVLDVSNIDLKEYYTPEMIEEYGEEFLRRHLRASMEASDKVIEKRVEARLKPIESSAKDRKRKEDEEAHARAEEQKQAFYDQVTALLPEWQEIDKDVRWHNWLRGRNEDGVERQVLLNYHSGARDAQRVVAMFRDFLEKSGMAPKPPAPSPTPPAVPPAGEPEHALSISEAPFPMTTLGYKQWKTELAKSRGLWRGDAELTKRIEARYVREVLSKLR